MGTRAMMHPRGFDVYAERACRHGNDRDYTAQVYAAMAAREAMARTHDPCDRCEGQGRDECEDCGGTGWVAKACGPEST